MANSLGYAAAVSEAQKSIMQFRVGAVIIRGGKVIGRGYNTHRSRARIMRQVLHQPALASMHAEVAAVLSCNRLRGSTILVARVSHGDVALGNAKPCVHCLKILAKSGVRRIIYTTGGTPSAPILRVEKTSQITTDKISFGNRCAHITAR